MFSVCLLMLNLVIDFSHGDLHFHKQWDDYLDYTEDEKRSTKLEDISLHPSIFESTRLPVLRYMPTVGNGKIASIVTSDTVYVDGVYNGELGESHRARFPNFINARLGFPNSQVLGRRYKVDAERGVYIENIVLEKHEVEQRYFAHRAYRSILVNQIFVKEKIAGSGPLEVEILINHGIPSTDIVPIDCASCSNRTDVEQQLGHTATVEDERYQKSTVKVFQAWNKLPDNVKFLGTKTLVMCLDGNEDGDFERSQTEFIQVLEKLDNQEDERLFDDHISEWARIWMSGKIEIEGNNLELAKAVIGAQYYILSSLPSRTEAGRRDKFWGLSPGGLANGALFADYQGHSFWDTETWMFPPVLLMWQDIAKDLILYRQATIEPTRDRALENGHKGSRFSWESAYTGTEVTPDCCPETRENQIHVTGDIAFAARQYFAASGDKAWLTGNEIYSFNVSANGCQFIREMAEFWASRAELNETSGQYLINGVMPPDEDAHYVNNSVYTNTIASYTIHFAKYISCICGDLIDPIPEEWLTVARNLKYIYDEEFEFHPEYDGYELGQTIKQADVVLLGFPLMHVTDPIKRRRDLDIYENVTRSNGPAMTWSMHAIGHVELGNMEKAEEMFNRSYQPYKMEPFKIWNEAQNQEGATNFITGMGGFLQSILFGYFGIRLKVDHLSLNPVLPLDTTSIIINGLDYHGCAINAIATEENVFLRVEGHCSLTISELEGELQLVIPDPVWEATFNRSYIRISSTVQSECPLPEDTLGGLPNVAAIAKDVGLVIMYSAVVLVTNVVNQFFLPS